MRRRKSGLYRRLAWIFWLTAIAGTGFVWYLADRSVPDRISIIENQQEEFAFPLLWKTTLSSGSTEVALGNESNIPADEITISSSEPFSIFAGEKGKLPGRFKTPGAY